MNKPSIRFAKGDSVRALYALVANLILMSFGICLAADPPNTRDSETQQLLRQQERQRALRQQQERAPDVRLEGPATGELGRLPKSETPCFVIHRIELKGDASERFQFALAASDQPDDPAIGRCLGTGGINLVMKRIQNAIIEKGYITTRVLAEPQDLTHGVLSLTLIPGRIRGSRFGPDSDRRATKWNALPAGTDDLLNLRDVEQGLENFQRVPTAEADIQITPAEGANAKPGESDLVINWRQAFPFRLNLSADDSGTESTGKYVGSVTLSLDHLLTLNDLFYFNFNHDLGGGDSGDRGTRGYTVHYSIPYGYWLFGFTTNSYNYHQTVAQGDPPFINSGESSNSEIRLSRLVYRDAVRKTTLSLSGWTRSSKNFIDDTEVEVQRRRMVGLEVGVGHREFIGAATFDLNLAYRQGIGALGALKAPEENFGEGTSRPTIFMAGANFNLPFELAKQQFRYNGEVRTQWNTTPLVPQDRFEIGGRYTVRGFDGENLLSAERGWLLRNDLGIAIGQTGQELYLGVDYAEVRGQSSKNLLGRRLAGAVIGLRGGYKGFQYDLFVGRPIDKPDGFQTVDTVTGFFISWSI